jgi:hypothetical protein
MVLSNATTGRAEGLSLICLVASSCATRDACGNVCYVHAGRVVVRARACLAALVSTQPLGWGRGIVTHMAARRGAAWLFGGGATPVSGLTV